MGLRERFENFTNGRRAPPRGLGFLRYLTGWTVTLAFVFSFAYRKDNRPIRRRIGKITALFAEIEPRCR
jgi:hypothetical protein